MLFRSPLEQGVRVEKLLLRQAFDSYEPELLPTEILWRKKEAFSDGVSGNDGSWYKIITETISKLNKQQKRYILNALKKELGMPVSQKTSATEPAAEPSAMSNMARQLSAMGQKQTSTGGTQVPTGTGVRHTAGKGQKIKQAKALKAKTATPKTKKAVAENKSYKMWGAK